MFATDSAISACGRVTDAAHRCLPDSRTIRESNRNLASGGKHEKAALGHQRPRGDGWHRIRPRGGGGVTVSGTASMGILGGEWLVPAFTANIVETEEWELHTDIDVTFTMSGQTDTGLTFGASIDLDESDGSGTGNDANGESPAFDGRTQGGEEIFISGAFGTLTMGDTDGALDWALKDVGLGSSLGEAHTAHLGYIGNDFVDDGNRYTDEVPSNDGDGQILRYDRSFGDFAVALSADIAEADGKDILSAGAKYNVSLPVMRLGVGIGWQQRAPHQFAEGDEKDAVGISLDAEFDNGFQIVLNWADMGDSHEGFDSAADNTVTEEFKGIGLAYMIGEWTFAANYGLITEGEPLNTGQEGYGIAVNYDMGGGAEIQLGFSESKCKAVIVDDRGNYSGGAAFEVSDARCFGRGDDDSAFSLGVAMNF